MLQGDQRLPVTDELQVSQSLMPYLCVFTDTVLENHK